MSSAILTRTLAAISSVDLERMAAVQARLDRQTKPRGSLGRLEEFARRFVAITGRETIRRKEIYTFAGDHGVAAEGVSAFPREVTPQMVYNFLAGGAGVNALARHAGAEVRVVDMGVDHDFGGLPGLIDRKIACGTANFRSGPAMSRAQALTALEAGITLAEAAVDAGIDLLGTGDMGIANTTPSAAIAAVFSGLPVAQVTHRGTGIDDKALAHKIAVIEEALRINQPNPQDPVDVLAKVGGFEIGGIAGLVLGCAARSVPVVVDGFISTAGALIACELHPQVREYIFAAHRSVEVGHAALLERIGQQPILDLHMRLGEGTGAALAMSLIEAALRGLREIATFDQAGVSRGSDQ
ncbi:nicotinate-nucleotide--dimethylbenzimidazole phosphoribosyltransferase [Geoalkalibacter halelectricus]|uniref:Nicotinate-nucleotide--dimethylbenzimidazole phosphoribosyltransferase n=1 Tax=Geoalkalibacter halelectricus TaxID=2847045 RepID=A0ABY5ZPG3_9BACT|nr:nicotinate-nucleotide--dimethylbenzimidazole phosphoribosyltransferase [Geoalkalibacter halelectricus]MDO3377516.1 nicotinate-nucleotide--dimethylbenzimidazole phosphoribosyltransferase [Geoalkalibacter halelectricus]UWZ80724.1 nicotinate-nucleotide--dimethylbenzimidazole phosphoribosyltransferase [Geoalkalibacter halelectricus]